MTQDTIKSLPRNPRLERVYLAQVDRAAEDLLDALRDLERDCKEAMTVPQTELYCVIGSYVRLAKLGRLNQEQEAA